MLPCPRCVYAVCAFRSESCPTEQATVIVADAVGVEPAASAVIRADGLVGKALVVAAGSRPASAPFPASAAPAWLPRIPPLS